MLSIWTWLSTLGEASEVRTKRSETLPGILQAYLEHFGRTPGLMDTRGKDSSIHGKDHQRMSTTKAYQNGKQDH